MECWTGTRESHPFFDLGKVACCCHTRPGGAGSGSRTRVSWVEARHSAVEPRPRLKLFPLAVEWSREPRPSRPGPPFVCSFPFQPDCQAARCNAPQLRALAPGFCRWSPRSHPSSPPVLTGPAGTTKKPPRPSGRGGFNFSGDLLHATPRVRSRLFGGSNLGGIGPLGTEVRAHEGIQAQPMQCPRYRALRSPWRCY